MLAEFAARMNCGGADVASTSSFMREMMHSQTRGSYDNVIATQTFGDEEEEEVNHRRLHSCCVQSHVLTCWVLLSGFSRQHAHQASCNQPKHTSKSTRTCGLVGEKYLAQMLQQQVRVTLLWLPLT